MNDEEIEEEEMARDNFDAKHRYYKEIVVPSCYDVAGPEILKTLKLRSIEDSSDIILSKGCDLDTSRGLFLMSHSDVGVLWRMWERRRIPGFTKIVGNRIIATLALQLHRRSHEKDKGPAFQDLVWNHYKYAMNPRAGDPLPGLEEAVSKVRVYANTFWIWIYEHAQKGLRL